MFFLSYCCQGVTVHLTSLGWPPTLCWSLDLLWGQLRVLSDPTPLCSCLIWRQDSPQLSGLVRFLLWELSVTFYIFHRHRVSLVDLVDLICSLYSWWEGFGSSSLATLPRSKGPRQHQVLRRACGLGSRKYGALEG